MAGKPGASNPTENENFPVLNSAVEVPLCVRSFVYGKWHWIWARPGCLRICKIRRGISDLKDVVVSTRVVFILWLCRFLFCLSFHSPTGTTLALLHLLGQADAGIHLHQASTAMEAAGLASQHKWGIILPTSARVANSIYEPAIATIYPTLCEVHDKQWRIGTPRCTSRTGYPTGPRYIRLHPSLYENRPVSADEARQVFRLITQGMQEFHIGNTAQTGLLVMTNRSEVKAALDSRPPAGDEQYIQVENVVTVAGATARHGLILQFNVGLLSGNSQKMTDDDINRIVPSSQCRIHPSNQQPSGGQPTRHGRVAWSLPSTCSPPYGHHNPLSTVLLLPTRHLRST